MRPLDVQLEVFDRCTVVLHVAVNYPVVVYLCIYYKSSLHGHMSIHVCTYIFFLLSVWAYNFADEMKLSFWVENECTMLESMLQSSLHPIHHKTVDGQKLMLSGLLRLQLGESSYQCHLLTTKMVRSK